MEQTYYDELAAQVWRDLWTKRDGDPIAVDPRKPPKALADVLKRIARESLEDGLRMAKACGVGDLKKDPFTQVPVPETPDQAHVRKVELQLLGKIEAQFTKAIAGQR